MIHYATPAIVAFLNRLVEADRDCIELLIESRRPCNKTMADHPTVQVHEAAGLYSVGMLGILNGFCGVFDDGPRRGCGPIQAVYEDGRLVKFLVDPEYKEVSLKSVPSNPDAILPLLQR